MRRELASECDGSIRCRDDDTIDAASNPVGKPSTSQGRGVTKRTLPDDSDSPTCIHEGADRILVASLIREKFLVPEFSASLRNTEIFTLFMSMPEATMDKDHGVPTLKS